MSRVPLGVAQARRIVTDFGPDVVFATGGYVAVPVGLAAKMCHRPLVIHEQTVGLGLANRSLARCATRIAVSSPSTLPLLPEPAGEIAVVTGNPVRPEILSGKPARAIEALCMYGFDLHRPTVYATGGARGSQQINTLVRDILPWLLSHANVIHQCGPEHLEELRQHAAGLPAELAARYVPTVSGADTRLRPLTSTFFLQLRCGSVLVDQAAEDLLAPEPGPVDVGGSYRRGRLWWSPVSCPMRTMIVVVLFIVGEYAT
jgi:UDP-N-acetylglucosamine--N-acetylmuramyl-(pentapeptide) pyrophosphoryl-undecaprenol N-acetylglucosamine transferase